LQSTNAVKIILHGWLLNLNVLFRIVLAIRNIICRSIWQNWLVFAWQTKSANIIDHLISPFCCFLCWKLGPNVTVGKNVVIHAGVRARESIILDGAVIQV